MTEKSIRPAAEVAASAFANGIARVRHELAKRIDEAQKQGFTGTWYRDDVLASNRTIRDHIVAELRSAGYEVEWRDRSHREIVIYWAEQDQED